MLGATSIWFVKIYNVTEVRGSAGSRTLPVAYPTAYRFFLYIRGAGSVLTTVPAEAAGRVQLGLGGTQECWR